MSINIIQFSKPWAVQTILKFTDHNYAYNGLKNENRVFLRGFLQKPLFTFEMSKPYYNKTIANL